MRTAPGTDTAATTERHVLRAHEVAALFGVATPTIYEHARHEPERWGVVRVGRAVRFRRVAIEALLHGER